MKTTLNKSIFLLSALMLTSFAADTTHASANLCSDIFVARAMKVSAKSLRIEAQVAKTVELIRARQIHAPVRDLSIEVAPKRANFFKALYKNGLVEAGPMTAMLADKIIHAKVIRKLLGPKAGEIHPIAFGLTEFLVGRGIVDDKTGQLLKSRSEIEKELRAQFPDGFIIKPAEGQASHGHGLIHDAKLAADLLIKKDESLWAPRDLTEMTIGPISGILGSGERFMIMALVPHSGFSNPDSPIATTNEFRVHIFDGYVLPESIFQRWRRPVGPEAFNQVRLMSQKFIDQMPLGYKARQAYSLDAFLLPDGSIRIIEVNTNSGHEATWSGFMRYPEVIAAHVKLIEKRYGWKFEGVSGDLLRSGFANTKNAVSHRAVSILDDLKDGHEAQERLLPDMYAIFEMYGEPLRQYSASGSPMVPETRTALDYINEFKTRLDQVRTIGDAKFIEFTNWLREEAN